MAPDSPYKVPLDTLEAVKVPHEDQVEGQDPTPPNPPVKSDAERYREQVIKGGAAG